MSISKRWWSKKEAKDNRDGAQSWLRGTLNVTTSREYTWTELRKLRDIPQQNQEHEDEPGFYLENIDPTQKSIYQWELQCEYTPYKEPQFEENPLKRPPEISFDSSLVETPTFFDYRDRPMTTTAGEFIEGIMVQIPIVDYTIKVNLPADPDWILSHLGGVNESPVKLRGLTWPKKCLLVAGVSGGAFQIENKTKFAEYGLRILGDPRSFESRVWNRGTMRLREMPTTSTNKNKKQYFLEPITTGDPPEYVDEPVPLDEAGQPLDDYLKPDARNPIQPGKLIELRFDVQRLVSFQKLPLQ